MPRLRAGTTTRAVYVLFGSKEGLLEALARRTFELLMDAIAAVPPSSDPGARLDQQERRRVPGLRTQAPRPVPSLLHCAGVPPGLGQRCGGERHGRLRATGRTHRASAADGPSGTPQRRGSDASLGRPVHGSGAPRDLRTHHVDRRGADLDRGPGSLR